MPLRPHRLRYLGSSARSKWYRSNSGIDAWVTGSTLSTGRNAQISCLSGRGGGMLGATWTHMVRLPEGPVAIPRVQPAPSLIARGPTAPLHHLWILGGLVSWCRSNKPLRDQVIVTTPGPTVLN
jgi:hypothetical protein